jgi:TP901-1 family phage major tail protein
MTITADKLPTNPNTSTATVGKDFLLLVNTGTDYATPTWTPVGGQRNSKLSQKADEIDVTDKTTGGWAAKLAGIKTWNIDLSGLVMLNNDGCTALGVAFRAGKTVDVKFQYPDKTFQRGWAAVTEYSYDVPHDGAAQLSGTLAGNGELSDITAAPTGA